MITFTSLIEKKGGKNSENFIFFILTICQFRGIGGIFFDDVDYPDQTKAFNFVKSCAGAILPSYVPVVERNVKKGYSYAERQWQLLRRGRLVFFSSSNLQVLHKCF